MEQRREVERGRRAAEAPPWRARVLVVDDVPTNIRLLARVLAPEHDVVAATSGAEALRLAELQPPDLILLDVEMPGMDGYAVCRRLKESAATATIPVIFVTARSDEADEVEGLSLGAVDYITKPFREAIVKARVRTHLELKRYRDLLQDRSYIDGLTGVPNRRRFDEFLARALANAQRGLTPISLLLIDVDHFKAYNDRLGHLAGDEALRRIAAELARGSRRENDLPARYGGEEFALVMPGTDADFALAAAERVRQRVLDLQLSHPASPTGPCVTVSIGLACLRAGEPATPIELIERADRVLYRAKQEGRNRVCAG